MTVVPPGETHLRRGKRLVRQVTTPAGERFESIVPAVVDELSPSAAYDQAWLRATKPPPLEESGPPVRSVDLFSGCGALTLGAWEACRALGRRLDPVLAVDLEDTALGVFQHNFPGCDCRLEDVTVLLEDSDALRERYGPVDLLLGGPPCQGHSDLNNHTRRDDPKNALYFTMARFAEVLQPRWILVENVPGAQHDRGGVVQRTWAALREQGYQLEAGVLRGEAIGVPQRRRRYFVLASKRAIPTVPAIQEALARPPRSLAWAIEDLLEAPAGPNATYDSSARHHRQNVERIRLLHELDIHDLPDEHRPACHRDKPHSYKSVYGRMHWDRPTQTITGGFGSCGQGRYVHPHRQRTLTPHEAARVQFVPDFFTFPEPRRRALQQMIGNAVPPRMAYALVLALLAGG